MMMPEPQTSDLPLEVLSLGAGVQSSTLALMCEYGELPTPDCAIFADVGAEPASVYKWLDKLEGTIKTFPIYRVSKGSLYDDSLRWRTSLTTGKRVMVTKVPFFVSKTDGSGRGMFNRYCTEDYKIMPLRRKSRELMKAAGLKRVRNWIGVSADEAHRMKDSPVKYIDNYYPLIERNMSRAECLTWYDAQKMPRPPRSACTFCPYHSDKEWARLARDEPEDFQRAVEWEKQVQTAYREHDETVEGVPF